MNAIKETIETEDRDRIPMSEAEGFFLGFQVKSLPAELAEHIVRSAKTKRRYRLIEFARMRRQDVGVLTDAQIFELNGADNELETLDALANRAYGLLDYDTGSF